MDIEYIRINMINCIPFSKIPIFKDLNFRVVCLRWRAKKRRSCGVGLQCDGKAAYLCYIVSDLYCTKHKPRSYEAMRKKKKKKFQDRKSWLWLAPFGVHVLQNCFFHSVLVFSAELSRNDFVRHNLWQGQTIEMCPGLAARAVEMFVMWVRGIFSGWTSYFPNKGSA